MEKTMKQFVFSNKYELRQMARLLPQGAVIRALSQDDITRVGNIVVLTSVGSKDEDDLVLEVAPAEEAAPADEGDDATDDNSSSEEDGKDCYW